MSHTHNRLSLDDPRLTAYALGELEASETQAFEALLAESPTAQAEVEVLRSLAGDLTSELSAVSADIGLEPEQRATVGRAALTPIPVVGWGAPSRGLWSSVALAACVLVGLPILSLMKSEEQAAPATSEGSFTALFSYTPESVTAGSGPEVRWVEPIVRDLQLPTPEPGSSGRGQRLPDQAFGTPYPFRVEAGPNVVIVTKGDEVRPGVNGVRSRWSALHIAAHGRLKAEQEARAVQKANELIGYTEIYNSGFRQDDVFTGTAANPSGVPFGTNAAPGSASTSRDAGVWFNDGKGGDYRARTENLFSRRYGFALRLVGGTPIQGEHYVHPGIDGFLRVTKRGGHTSTFGVDVDTASYSNIRRILNQGRRPHPAAVRLEEFVNYFDYAYKAPADDAKQPFATHVQVAACPWNPKHRLARIALKGKEFKPAERPASNLVFLVDVSGSMKSEDKLPLLQSGLEMLTENLDKRDRVSIITYSSSASLALETTAGDQNAAILASIRGLKAGGSTNGAAGIQLAYEEAQKGFLKEGVNRVILCTDGDFNVGVSDGMGLTQLVQKKAKGGVYLSVLGFGTGNLQDGKMEAYSNAGNGNYAYIDSLDEARRVLVEQMQGTLITIAKDVKFQVWFNPKTVVAWRLLGYENRRLAAKDFNDDSKDAGDIGAGHEVTALYELIPTGMAIPGQVDPNPFIQGTAPQPKKDGAKKPLYEPTPKEKALFVWRLRWKQPDGDTSSLIEQNVFDGGLGFDKADRDFQWAAAVTAFGMQLRHSPHRGQTSFDLIEELAKPAKGEDPKGRRAEFLGLVAKAKGM